MGYFKYSEHNTNRAQSSGRRVGGYSLYQRSMDSMRYRTPRNNMLDERNGRLALTTNSTQALASIIYRQSWGTRSRSPLCPIRLTSDSLSPIEVSSLARR